MTGSRRAPAAGKRGGSTGVWIALALAYVALIFFVSSRPYLHAPGPEFDMKDKLAHATEYGVLGAILALAFARGSARAPAVSLLLVVAIGATIASADEMFQGTVPGRQRDIADWVADVSGVVIGAGIVLGGALRRARTEEQEP